MSLFLDLQPHIIDAMRAKDAARLSAFRNLKAAFANELLALKHATTETLTDDEALAVVRRLTKQRKDSIEQFRKGAREELAAAEEAELKILEAFLPAPMSETEVRKIAEAIKQKLGITGKSKLGQLIGAVVKETKGRADGIVVKKVAESLLS